MSKTACWMTNNSFDCAWVYFGYGSRHDMLGTPGYWISLDGLKILVEYDYDVVAPLHAYLNWNKIEDIELLKMLNAKYDEDSHVMLSDKEASLLPLNRQMEFSSIHIDHPEGKEKSLEWFEAIKPISGKYFKQGYEEVWCGYADDDWFKMNIPSLNKISEINPYHFECIQRLEMMVKNYDYVMNHSKKHHELMLPNLATDNDLLQLALQFEEEIKEREEKFKLLKIWENL